MESSRTGSPPTQENLIRNARYWIEQKKAELAVMQEQITKLNQEYEQMSREVEILETWVQEVGAGAGRTDEAKSVIRFKRGGTMGWPQENYELRGDRLRDAVVEVLTQAYPEELYYREILNRLVAEGYQVAGKDPGLNLLAHLQKESRVERAKKRGMYKLRDSSLSEKDK